MLNILIMLLKDECTMAAHDEKSAFHHSLMGRGIIQQQRTSRNGNGWQESSRKDLWFRVSRRSLKMSCPSFQKYILFHFTNTCISFPNLRENKLKKKISTREKSDMFIMSVWRNMTVFCELLAYCSLFTRYLPRYTLVSRIFYLFDWQVCFYQHWIQKKIWPIFSCQKNLPRQSKTFLQMLRYHSEFTLLPFAFREITFSFWNFFRKQSSFLCISFF